MNMEKETIANNETPPAAAAPVKAAEPEETINKKVALIDLGGELRIDLEVLAKKLNSLQEVFEFIYAGKIEDGKTGDPTIDNLYYDFDTLFGVIETNLPLTAFKFVVAVTNCRITDKEEPGIKLTIRDYFSYSDTRNWRLSLICINDKVYEYNHKLKNAYQYTAYQIVSELLINITRQDLMHVRSNGCLFDDCEQRDTFTKSIEKSLICEACQVKLKAHPVDERIIEAARKILNYSRKNNWKASLIKTFINPVTQLILGAGLGWFLSSNLLKDVDVRFILAGMGVIFLMVFSYVKFKGR